MQVSIEADPAERLEIMPHPDAIDVSIVIVNWNTRDLLGDCLRSIEAETRRCRYEILVADNASRDGSVEMLRAEFPEVRVFETGANLGFAGGNNAALAHARGRYLLLLNTDTLILEGAIDACVDFADARPEAGVVGCRLLNEDRSLQPSCFQFPSLSNLLLQVLQLNKLAPASRLFGKERMSWWQHDDERAVQTVVGAFLLARREAFEQVGPLDDRFFMYAEESDWCRRIGAAGWRVLFNPEAEVVHLGGASSVPIEGQMFLQHYGSLLLFIRKHHGRVYYACFALLLGALFALRAGVWSALGLLRPGESRGAANREALWRLCSRGAEGLCFRPPGLEPAERVERSERESS